jgi:phosphatidylinositol phospholipase C delta
MPATEASKVATEAISGASLARGDAKPLPLSPRLQAFLASEGLQPDEISRAALLKSSETDTSHKLSNYFISSSHNTYLSANQLTGKASTDRYKDVLMQGVRCVEIDAWASDEDEVEQYGPIKVTHG